MKKREHSKEYTDYLKSPRWFAKREEIFNTRGRICEACKSTKYLQVHHKTYDRLGNEDKSDLKVLCGRCHKGVHKLARKLRNLALATDVFIEQYKPEIREQLVKLKKLKKKTKYKETPKFSYEKTYKPKTVKLKNRFIQLAVKKLPKQNTEILKSYLRDV